MIGDNMVFGEGAESAVSCSRSAGQDAGLSSSSRDSRVLSVSSGDCLHIAWGGVLSQKAGCKVHGFTFEQDFGLLFVNRGTLQVLVDGRPFSVSKGQVLMIWPGEACVGAEPNKSDLVCQWLTFRVEQVPDRGDQNMIRVPRLAEVCNPTRIAELFRLLTDEYHAFQVKGEPLRLLSNQGSSFLLLSLLSRLSAVDPERPLDSNALTVLAERAKDYIRANHEVQISAADVAKAMDCSTGYLRKAFRHACGCCPSSYILQMRLRKARESLASTRAPIGQIAQDCGFGSLSYFTRVFTRNEGMTPREYRVTHSHSYTTPGI